jgi:hypothetical protein
MPKDWSDYARDDDKNKNAIYEEDDFRAAAHQLLTQQILYESDKSDRVAYQLISSHRHPFREAFDLFGMDIEFDPDYRYCVAIPRLHRRTQLTLIESLLMLVLRKVYHEQAIHGEVTNGSAHISIDELQEAFRAETGREMPTTTRELDPLFDTMKRFGILRKTATEAGDPQPFSIEIRPGIEKLVNENMLTRMSAYQNASVALQESASDNAEEESDETA